MFSKSFSILNDLFPISDLSYFLIEHKSRWLLRTSKSKFAFGDEMQVIKDLELTDIGESSDFFSSFIIQLSIYYSKNYEIYKFDFKFLKNFTISMIISIPFKITAANNAAHIPKGK